MAVAGLENLSVLRITRIVQALQDARERRPNQYRFLARVNEVPAANGELMARFVGRVLIADLIALDSAAGVYSSGKMTFESNELPKIKIGRTLTESQLLQFEEIRAGGAGVTDEQVLDFVGPIVTNTLDGIEQRKEALLVAMYRDALNYDRLGFKASGITWGMPSDLKVVPSIPWTSTSATPIDDILTLTLLARMRYGVEYNRLIMSTAAFRYAINTTQFQNMAKAFLPLNLTVGTNFAINALPPLQRVFETVLGQGADGGAALTIELNDDRYWYQQTDGSIASARFQPINEVFLESSTSDRNNAVKDLAKGLVPETMFLGLNPASVVGGGTVAPGRRMARGPIGYMTYPPEVNPANLTLWGVDVAWPRKNVLQANALMTVGAFGDQIAVGEPF